MLSSPQDSRDPQEACDLPHSCNLGLLVQVLYEFPVDAVTNDHKLGNLRQHKFISQSRGGQISKIKVLAGPHSLCRLLGRVLCCLLHLLGDLGIPWLMPLSLQPLPLSSLSVSQISICLSLRRAPVIGFGLHPKSQNTC